MYCACMYIVDNISKSGDCGVDGGSCGSDTEDNPLINVTPGGGVTIENNSTIIFEDVPIITPNLDIVVPKLSLEASIDVIHVLLCCILVDVCICVYMCTYVCMCACIISMCFLFLF